MQPYRLTGGDTRIGPQQAARHLCQHDECNELAEVQYRRHATATEYEAIGENHKPIDGIAHVAVFVCGDHEPDPICGPDHHQAMPSAPQDLLAVECPKCGAAVAEACVKANGGVRSAAHKDRIPPPSSHLPDRCDHVHREDCEGLGACECRPDDAAPERRPREVLP